MARFTEPTKEQLAGWKAWVAERPDNVRQVAESFEPWSLYRMKDTGQRCTLVSFGEGEDGSVTLTVNITGEFNAVIFDRSVFGVDPDSLESCDLPPKTEAVGAALTDSDDIDEFVDAVRPAVLAARAGKRSASND